MAAKQPLTKLPQFTLLKEVGVMKDYSAVVPIGHRIEVDALVFLQKMIPNTKALIEKIGRCKIHTGYDGRVGEASC